MAFVRIDIKCVVEAFKSETSERIWHYLHLDIGTYAFANWYRSPSTGEEQIQELDAEMAGLKNEVLGCIVMGDMNIHHRRWLRHSNDNTSLGAQLKEVCDDHALRQLIREPITQLSLLLPLFFSLSLPLVSLLVLCFRLCFFFNHKAGDYRERSGLE